MTTTVYRPATVSTGDSSITGNVTITGDETVTQDLTIDTNTLFVDSANNRVGILTTSPSVPLDVRGNMNLTPTAGAGQIYITTAAAANAIIKLKHGSISNGTLISSIAGDNMTINVNNAERLRIDSGGNVGIATDAPSQKLHVSDSSIRIDTAKTPASAADTGTQGQVAWDSSYFYVCIATDTWQRVAHATW